MTTQCWKKRDFVGLFEFSGLFEVDVDMTELRSIRNSQCAIRNQLFACGREDYSIRNAS